MNIQTVTSNKIINKEDISINYNNAKIWQIAFFALNNTATNIGMFLMGFYALFTQNVLGLSAVTIGLIATFMRIFDGITDPVIGFFLDKTNGKFGKFRPFMIVGNIIIVMSLIAIFNCPITLSTSSKYAYTTIFYFVYVIGYTFQTACTKGAQAALTNNPKQRPLFSVFDGIYNTLLFSVAGAMITSVMAPRYEKSIIDPMLWRDASFIFCSLSIVLTILAVIGIWNKDREEYFGLGQKGVTIKFRDYLPTIKENRPLQMLIIAAATDKLAGTTLRAAQIYMFANILMNVSLQGKYSMITVIPVLVLTSFGIMLARKVGQKKAFLLGTWGSMILLCVMYIVGPNPNAPWIYLGLLAIQGVFMNVASNIVIPMIADCADYETYRTGRFVPGMLGTIFSFVDKFISSFSTAIWGLALGAIGLASTVIVPETFISNEFNAVVMFCVCGLPILGHVASILAMKFYTLDDKKMAEIQIEIARIKGNNDKN